MTSSERLTVIGTGLLSTSIALAARRAEDAIRGVRSGPRVRIDDGRAARRTGRQARSVRGAARLSLAARASEEGGGMVHLTVTADALADVSTALVAARHPALRLA